VGGRRVARAAPEEALAKLGDSLAALPVGLALLLIGYASIAVTDPWLARWGGAPRHFARLRPPQMVVALVGLLALFLLSLH